MSRVTIRVMIRASTEDKVGGRIRLRVRGWGRVGIRVRVRATVKSTCNQKFNISAKLS